MRNKITKIQKTYAEYIQGRKPTIEGLAEIEGIVPRTYAQRLEKTRKQLYYQALDVAEHLLPELHDKKILNILNIKDKKTDILRDIDDKTIKIDDPDIPLELLE